MNSSNTKCDVYMITAFIEEIRNNIINNELKMLAAYRRSLLDNIHKERRRIDCLDYLVYTMKKKPTHRN